MTVEATDRRTVEYHALVSGAVAVNHIDNGPLAVSGDDRADFLNRLTTNDIVTLSAGESAVTVLTNSTARILFVFTVISRTEDLLLLPAAGQSQKLAQHLRSQIFFMDKIEVKPPPLSRWRILGPQSGERMDSLGWQIPATEGAWTDSGPVMIVRQDEYDIPGYEILASDENAEGVSAQLRVAGVQSLTDQEAYTLRRIEIGRPAPGSELNDQYNPLEAGLEWACSGTKGCYTGQEIIARQTNYDKITKKLIGLVSDSELLISETAYVDGKAVGRVTSSAYSPQRERYIGLSILRRPHNQPGAQVTVGDAIAMTVALPFEQSSRNHLC